MISRFIFSSLLFKNATSPASIRVAEQPDVSAWSTENQRILCKNHKDGKQPLMVAAWERKRTNWFYRKLGVNVSYTRALLEDLMDQFWLKFSDFSSEFHGKKSFPGTSLGLTEDGTACIVRLSFDEEKIEKSTLTEEGLIERQIFHEFVKVGRQKNGGFSKKKFGGG